MRVIVTRPAAQAAAWVADLRAAGVDAVALPLIDIAPPADPAPVAQAWRTLPGTSLAMFVSANAVAQFFAAAPARPPAWPDGVRAGATGPGTSAALRAAGVPAGLLVQPPADAPSFDSEALWALLEGEDWRGRRVLVVRGEDGRDWLADMLSGHGAELRFVAAYSRRPPRLDEAGAALLAVAHAQPQTHAWLFSSSEALGHLRGLLPGADWSASRAAASHPRIAQAARDAGFAQVVVLPPRLDAVVAWAQELDVQGPSIQSAAP